MNAPMPTLLNLLGMAPIIADGQSGKTAESSESGAFDLIFQAFMASPVQANLAEMPNAGIATIDDPAAGFAGDALVPVSEEAQAADPHVSEMPELIDSAVMKQTLSLRMPTTIPHSAAITYNSKPEIDGNVVEVINNPMITTRIAQPKMIEAMTASLPQGTFAVKATSVENGLVTFDLASESDAQTLKVTIPVDSIDTHGDNNLQSRGTRLFAGIATNRDGIDIEQLISRANVTGLTISSSSAASTVMANDTKSSVDTAHHIITITATQQGKAIQLFASPRPAEIVAQIQPVAAEKITQKIATQVAISAKPPVIAETGTAVADPSIDDNQFFENASRRETSFATQSTRESVDNQVLEVSPKTTVTSHPTEKTQIAGKPVVANQWTVNRASLSQTADSATSPVEQKSLQSAQTAMTELGADETPVTTASVHSAIPHDTPTVNTIQAAHPATSKESAHSLTQTSNLAEPAAPIALPKELNMTTVQPGGTKTVTLQLNPEHLGTARVHLTVQDDMVSARVVVNSHHAKAVVEGSLNDLLQQFERANIRVEQIHVAVSGEWQNSEHHRRQFHQAPRPASRFLKDDDGSESIVDTVTKLFAPKQSPAFAGLNILA